MSLDPFGRWTFGTAVVALVALSTSVGHAAVFCTKCGKKFELGEGFCSADGTPLKTAASGTGDPFVQSAGTSAPSVPDILKLLTKSVVTIKTDKGTGTGFVYGQPDVIVTNYHVIDGATEIKANIKDGKPFRLIKLLKEDPERDLAVFQAEAQGLVPIQRAETCRVGEDIITIGTSSGHFEFTVSDGVISAFRGGSAAYDRAIQISAPISPGNSGGPLLNRWGKVVGVNTWSWRSGQNLNFSVPIDYVDRVLAPLAPTSLVTLEEGAPPAKPVSAPMRKAKFPLLLKVCRKYMDAMLGPPTIGDILMLLRALHDIEPTSPFVNASLAKANCFAGRERQARSFLDQAMRSLGSADAQAQEMVDEASITLHAAFGEDSEARKAIEAWETKVKNAAPKIKAGRPKLGYEVAEKKKPESELTFLERYSEHGVKGHIVPPMIASKVLKVKGKPKGLYSFTLGGTEVEVWVYLRVNQWDDTVRCLMLYIIDGVYWTQGNTLNYLPNKSQVESILAKDYSNLTERSEAAWKAMEADSDLVSLYTYFPEFNGLSWRVKTGVR